MKSTDCVKFSLRLEPNARARKKESWQANVTDEGTIPAAFRNIILARASQLTFKV